MGHAPIRVVLFSQKNKNRPSTFIWTPFVLFSFSLSAHSHLRKSLLILKPKQEDSMPTTVQAAAARLHPDLATVRVVGTPKRHHAGVRQVTLQPASSAKINANSAPVDILWHRQVPIKLLFFGVVDSCKKKKKPPLMSIFALAQLRHSVWRATRRRGGFSAGAGH